jgi:hypothetical protein
MLEMLPTMLNLYAWVNSHEFSTAMIADSAVDVVVVAAAALSCSSDDEDFHWVVDRLRRTLQPWPISQRFVVIEVVDELGRRVNCMQLPATVWLRFQFEMSMV